ncbi:MAG: response regulator [Leptospirales bacterium]|nr:response regulator [Leptospirales bacterium]
MEENRLPTILVVDDEEVIRTTIQKKLSRDGYNVIPFEKSEDLLYHIKNSALKADMVITDIKLHKMDGIELLRRINNLDEPIPVLIISGHGDVEDAIKALRYGARDYIRKPFDINDITSSVKTILKKKFEKKLSENFAKFKLSEKSVLEIPNNTDLINTVSFNFTKDLTPAGLFDHTTSKKIYISLQEAIANAMFHGNFEINSSLRESGGMKEFNNEINKRKVLSPYKDRTIKITYELTQDYVVYEITDQGPGFNFQHLPDLNDPENFFKTSGRGLLIILLHMDEVTWHDRGNIIRMKKYKADNNSKNKEANYGDN